MPEKPFLNVKEVAAFLDLTEPSVYRLCKRGVIPSYKFGGTVRIARDDLEEFVQSAKQVIVRPSRD
jgi:excisionase family DNA binding protein